MAITRPKPDKFVSKLRQVEVLMGQGMPRIDAIRQISITEQTYYRWKKKVYSIPFSETYSYVLNFNFHVLQ